MVRKSVRTGALALVGLLIACSAWAQSENMDELYKRGLKEGGSLNFYGTLAQINAEKILPVFEKRYPGLKINHIDATNDKLVRGS